MIFIPEMQRWFDVCKPTSVIQHINKMKNKNHTIISIDTVKTLNKIKYPFHDKSCHQTSYRGNIP